MTVINIIRRKSDGQWYTKGNQLVTVPNYESALTLMGVIYDNEYNIEVIDSSKVIIPNGIELMPMVSDEDITGFGKDQVHRPFPAGKQNAGGFMTRFLKEWTKYNELPLEKIMNLVGKIVGDITGHETMVMEGEDDGPWCINRTNEDGISQIWTGGSDEKVEIPIRKMADELCDKMNKEDPEHHYEVGRPPKKEGWTMEEIMGEDN